ncbi:hypothetical protein DPX39_090085900 [Trypanosoma brucei equiperdum]|uniref:Uncharacterized protein n=1 Tax=Trypanosoma brucei equiperdum TaxID=630700 RepID=A0A3L6L0F8_9TRYP|nr:hypothetical protein DPX39_090085900 [Trypanosoma brucei equiperdum]
MWKQRRNDQQFIRPMALGIIAVLFVLCLWFGYHHGSCAAESRSTQAEAARRLLRKKELKECSDDCNELTEKVLRLNTEIGAVLAESAKFEEEIKKVTERGTGADNDRESCPVFQGAAEHTGGSSTTSGAGPRSEKPIPASVPSSRDSKERVSPLKKALDSSRQMYKRVCGRTPGCTILSDESLLQHRGGLRG